MTTSDPRDIRPDSARLLEHTFAALSDAVFVVDPHTRVITACNQAIEQMFGYCVEDVLGRTTEFLHVNEETYREFGQRLLPAIGSEGIFRTRFRMRRKDGTVFETENTVTGAVDATGAQIGVVSVVHDISEQVMTQEKMRQQLQALAHVERVSRMGEIASSLAHELNQPLTGILANSQAALRFLEGEIPDLDEVRSGLEDIVEDSRRATAFIRSLRGLLRKEDPARRPIDLNEAIREVLTLNRSEAITRNVPVRARLARSLPTIHGDAVMIQQVLLNLLLNAEQIMTEAQVDEAGISLTTTVRRNGEVVVTVSDTGPGIPAASLERVFEAFYTTRPDGTGMGLAISRSIIEAHGGRIWAENRRSGGARVCFSLPVTEEEDG